MEWAVAAAVGLAGGWIWIRIANRVESAQERSRADQELMSAINHEANDWDPDLHRSFYAPPKHSAQEP